MTTDELVRRLGQTGRRLKVLRADNQRLWDSREAWKTKHRQCARQNTELRRQLKRARAQRDMWRARAPHKVSGKPSTAGVVLSAGDLERILAIPPRD